MRRRMSAFGGKADAAQGTVPGEPRTVWAQMRRCLGCRVFHLDSNVKGITPAPLRSPRQARPYGGIPVGSVSERKVGYVAKVFSKVTSLAYLMFPTEEQAMDVPSKPG